MNTETTHIPEQNILPSGATPIPETAGCALAQIENSQFSILNSQSEPAPGPKPTPQSPQIPSSPSANNQSSITTPTAHSPQLITDHSTSPSATVPTPTIQPPDLEYVARLNHPMRPSRRASAARQLSALADITDLQLRQLDQWLDSGFSYKKISDLCRDIWERHVPIQTIRRYYHRSRTREFLDDAPAAHAAAREISRYAVSGRAAFSTATLHILEARAFDLARTFERHGQIDLLKDIFLLIHKAKNTSVRERHAKVQERKCDLREDEFQFKKQQAAKRDSSAQLNKRRSSADLQSASDAEPNSTSETPPSPAALPSIANLQFSTFNSQSKPAPDSKPSPQSPNSRPRPQQIINHQSSPPDHSAQLITDHSTSPTLGAPSSIQPPIFFNEQPHPSPWYSAREQKEQKEPPAPVVRPLSGNDENEPTD